ncbi:alpha/beta hydrolase family protein [Streptomyces sp. NBC_00053]|uniref:alpha/beta hydrolase n=1 Tax=unclassified Streptomyces TaxID=2593676 RepID=UPI000F5BEB72|nr:MULTISPECIES: alpha/beta hydrolase [unclassified Streptomyces]WSG53779.1 alpha/beta hydrolase family protein [Streptomyces sp. NBC_01732]MCX5163402.1 alpha/beta hydrolase family protein [Streptomyces sp. NBC_00305]MCX5221926.1 alpha/beta hydrolase family protein [Streptomyces sp. NBC_00264]MCX5503624.1 alpha/beta hydrolase family protein [Streptomyces sp. NBC_00052]MCX5547841.1 alpha/beta hydrolase family protein [Streptomyces sp. NBC_00051]
MDLATLKAFKPSEYEGAADAYRATGDMASAAKDTIDNQICAGIRNQLKGEAANAAARELRELSKNFHYAQTECGLVSTALNGFAFDMAVAKQRLEAAIEDARADHCTVNANGSVTYPAGKKPGDEKTADGGTVTGSTGGSPTSDALERQAANMHPNPNYGRAMAYANRIADALKEATDADEKWAPKLRALRADDDLKVSKRDWADAQSDMGGVREAGKSYLDSLPEPPKDGSPKDNASWWNGLSPEERAAWLSLRPDTVGALDGLPSTVRDEANRVVLSEKQGELQLELDSIPKPPANEWTWIKAGQMPSRVHTDEWMAWYNKYGDRYEQLNKSLKGMQSIQDRFAQTGEEGLPEAYLLGFSPEGNGRAIVANGNPDTADHQAVYVPGTTSNLGGISGDIGRMVNVWRVADAAPGNDSVSTITWLGYDAPQNIVKDSPFSHYANDGAPAFNQFMDGLDASHTGDSDPHRTAIGHSYGTTLIGSAARQGDLNADDVILAGSPGVQVPKAEQLDVPSGHVWNQEADGDPVPDIGRYGHGGTDWDGPWTIPSDERFGANQMTTDTEGHSDYWKEESDSLWNQGQVVAGNSDNVKLKPPPNYWAHVK